MKFGKKKMIWDEEMEKRDLGLKKKGYYLHQDPLLSRRIQTGMSAHS